MTVLLETPHREPWRTSRLSHTAIALQTKLYVDRRVLKTREKAAAAAAEAAANGGAAKKEKPKKSWTDTLQTLRESPKIMNLALLVVCYALSHRLFEFAWKGQLCVLFPTTQAYSGALADVSIYTGAELHSHLPSCSVQRLHAQSSHTHSMCKRARVF